MKLHVARKGLATAACCPRVSIPTINRLARALAAFAPVALLAACGGSGGGGAGVPLAGPVAPPPVASLEKACASFAATDLPHKATITKSALRKAEGTLPEVCVVRGSIFSSAGSTIQWAVELPASAAWNGKTITIGGGAFDGFIPTDDPRYQAMVGTSANPYVKISSDSGHQTRGFEWASDDVALRNHAFEANHSVLEVGTQIAIRFYGKAPTRRYSFGHSNGGRSSLVAAQRYPRDYDGVIALEPAISQQGHEANNVPMLRHFFEKPENWLSPAKLALYAKAETRACDSLDGLADGIIGNIEACNYVPTELLCEGADNDECLTAGQIESIRLIYTDRRVEVALADGASGYPRFGRGGAATSDWRNFMFGSSFEARDSFNYFVGYEAAKVVAQDPAVDYMRYDPTQYQAQWTRLSNLIDGTNPDLSPFAGNGGKMLIWYGLADACVSLYRTAEYVDSVKARMGASQFREFARFITSPSVGHGLDGPGAGSIDLVAAMDNWVERGAAPDKLVASKFEPGSSTPILQRPACEYPMFPRYDGSGDPAKASSFACSAT